MPRQKGGHGRILAWHAGRQSWCTSGSITWNVKAFIHESMGTYFEENGVMAAFTRAQGLEWDGPESIDEYC